MKNSKLFITEEFLNFFNNDEKCIVSRNYTVENYGGWDYGTCDIACYYLYKLQHQEIVNLYLNEYFKK